jgi:uncharacterized protein YehS (DUF1456 family)
MAKDYTLMRIDREAMENLKQRVQKINKVDLKKMGIKKQIKQIDLARFLFRNPIYISDNELRAMTNSRRRGRLC